MALARESHAVTGAFGYSGKYIAQRLLDAGYQVRTLTNSPNRPNPFGDRIKAYPFNFDNYPALVNSLQGASVLYNTYWVRFNHKDFRHSIAIDNTLKLFKAAKEAGVGRIVHVSITNPSENSPLEYFKGKARLERALIESGVSHAILRPTVLFGKEDILINNIAWFLRSFPVFGVFGNGRYRLQPIHVDDLAELAVQFGRSHENTVINAIGPETFTYRELIEKIGRIINKNRLIVSIPPRLGCCMSWFLGKIVGDIPITWEEIEGLMSNLLYVDSSPTGQTKLTNWAKEHSFSLGLHYSNELARRKDRLKSYDDL